MQIYNYHSETKEFLGTEEAYPDPLEPGRFLIPAHATEIKPEFDLLANKAIVFNVANQLWELMDDFRKTKLWKKSDCSEYVVEKIGELPDYTIYTDKEPVGNVEWVDNDWQLKPIMAMGKDLEEFINQTKSSLTNSESWDLLDKLAPFFNHLKQSRANPMNLQLWQDALVRLNQRFELTEKEQAVLFPLLEVWKQDKKFAEDEESSKKK